MFLLMLGLLTSCHAKTIIFGAITTENPVIVEEKFAPLLRYLETKTGEKIVFRTGRTYERTIESFVGGEYQFGWIGPAPYVTATKFANHGLRLLATPEHQKGHTSYGVIVVRKDSPITSLKQLQGKKFAFGSPESTLSYFLPASLLQKSGIFSTLDYSFLQRHDKVAKYVIIGKYDAGAVKSSIAKEYGQYLKVIAKTEAAPDFAFVATKSCNKALFEKLERALLELKDPKILESTGKETVRLIRIEDKEFDNLRKYMKEVAEKNPR